MMPLHSTFALVCVGVTLALPVQGVQQAAPSPPSAPAAATPTADEDKKEAPPSLDDLLGIEEDEDQRGPDAAAAESDEELKRKLNEAEIVNSFALAIEKMSISAELLDVRFDTGLGTQRVQEDIIAKLEHLIDQAKKNSNSSSSSSSSSQSDSSSARRNQDQQKNPGQQPNQPNPQGNDRNNNPSDSEEGDPPPAQQGDVNSALEEERSEWGNLPPRVRDQLLQGRREKFSSLYQQLTQEYYKRLAEEGSP